MKSKLKACSVWYRNEKKSIIYLFQLRKLVSLKPAKVAFLFNFLPTKRKLHTHSFERLLTINLFPFFRLCTYVAIVVLSSLCNSLFCSIAVKQDLVLNLVFYASWPYKAHGNNSKIDFCFNAIVRFSLTLIKVHGWIE